MLEQEQDREHARALVAQKYGLVRRLNYWVNDVLRVVRRQPKRPLVYVVITLELRPST